MILLKVVSVQLVWLARVGVYLSAKQQVFIAKPLPKRPVWAFFVMAVVVSFVLIGQLYHSLTAALFVLLIVMFAWIVLALVAPHYPQGRVVFPAGTLLMLGISLLGGAHVG